MPAALPDDVRDAIIAAIRAGGTCRGIAKAHNVSASTVSKLAREAHLPDAFERSQTEKATRAAVFDAKAARAQMLQDLYADAQKFRERAWSQYTQLVPGGMNGPMLVTTKLPPIREQQAAMTALAICLDKALKLETYDSDEGAAAGKTMVNDLFGALELAYYRIVAEDEGHVDLEAPMEESPGA